MSDSEAAAAPGAFEDETLQDETAPSSSAVALGDAAPRKPSITTANLPDVAVPVRAGEGSLEDLLITVENPLKHGDTMFDSHVVYTVVTKVTRPYFHGNDFSVYRRYNDFVWLRDQLIHDRAANIIPPLPPKHATKVNKFDPVFLERRRAALQRFLRRVAAHPILSHDENFVAFLEAKSHELVTVKKEKDRSGVDKFADNMNKLTSKMLVSSRDDEFLIMEEATSVFEEKIKATATNNQAYYDASMGMAVTQRDLATGFQAMCESDPAMKHVFMTIAQALEKSHAASVETTNKFLTHVTEPFADYTGYPASMRETQRFRDLMQLYKEDAEKELKDRRAELAKESSSDQRTSVAAIFGKDPEAVKKEKVDRLSGIVQTLEKAVEYNINRSDKMNAHMRAEFERLEEYKALELRHCYRQWADLEVDRYTKLHDSWSETESALEHALSEELQAEQVRLQQAQEERSGAE